MDTQPCRLTLSGYVTGQKYIAYTGHIAKTRKMRSFIKRTNLEHRKLGTIVLFYLLMAQWISKFGKLRYLPNIFI